MTGAGSPAGKYARFELERRFLAERPPGLDEERGWRIGDRYVDGTSLRLRRMEPIGGGEPVFKLGQKHVPAPPDFARTTITNVYLSAEEYEVFAALEAAELRKRRHEVEHGGRTFGLDVFEGRLEGLVLAEVGFETEEELARPLDLPPWVIREVSDDVRFTGGALAGLAPEEAAELVRRYRG